MSADDDRELSVDERAWLEAARAELRRDEPISADVERAIFAAVPGRSSESAAVAPFPSRSIRWRAPWIGALAAGLLITTVFVGYRSLPKESLPNEWTNGGTVVARDDGTTTVAFEATSAKLEDRAKVEHAVVNVPPDASVLEAGRQRAPATVMVPVDSPPADASSVGASAADTSSVDSAGAKVVGRMVSDFDESDDHAPSPGLAGDIGAGSSTTMQVLKAAPKARASDSVLPPSTGGAGFARSGGGKPGQNKSVDSKSTENIDAAPRAAASSAAGGSLGVPSAAHLSAAHPSAQQEGKAVASDVNRADVPAAPEPAVERAKEGSLARDALSPVGASAEALSPEALSPAISAELDRLRRMRTHNDPGYRTQLRAFVDLHRGFDWQRWALDLAADARSVMP